MSRVSDKITFLLLLSPLGRDWDLLRAGALFASGVVEGGCAAGAAAGFRTLKVDFEIQIPLLIRTLAESPAVGSPASAGLMVPHPVVGPGFVPGGRGLLSGWNAELCVTQV